MQSLIVCIVFFSALMIAIIIIRFASSIGLIDVPNARSAHSRPTPRGGGLGIVIATAEGVWFCERSFGPEVALRGLLLGSGAVAAVGLWDDFRAVPAGVRLVVHIMSGIVLVLSFHNGLTIQILSGGSIGGIPAAVLSCLGVVCLINIFNFMDGIDGLAASEAVFVAGGAALLISMRHAQSNVVTLSILVSAASAGFLVVNWSPARVFMGDVGSGFLGFALGALALWAGTDHVLPIWTWMILGTVFIADASITLVRRLLRGEKIMAAHRMHGYQRLARQLSSHRSATLAAVLINCLWLFPLAALSAFWPEWAVWIFLTALAPVCVAVWKLGAGLPG